jgi:hypothetical protein
MIIVGYTTIQAVSCYSAKQAFEVRKQALQSETSDISNLRTGDNPERIAHKRGR